MKKLISFLIIMLVAFSYAAFSQDASTTQENFNSGIVQSIYQSVQTFLKYLNFTFIITFILAAWIINDSIDAENFANNAAFLNKIPRVIRSFFIGLGIAAIFIWGFQYSKRIEVMSLFFSILVSMVIYQIGIKNFLRFISERILKLKFNN